MASVYAESQGQLLRPSEAPCASSKQRRRRRHDCELACPAPRRPAPPSSLLEWLQGLGTVERQQVLAVENNWVAAMVRQMLARKLRDGDVVFAPFVRNSRFESGKLEDYFTVLRPEGEYSPLDTELEQHLRLCDSALYLDTLTLSWELISDSSRLLRLIEAVSKAEAFKYPCMAYWDSNLKSWAWECPNWTACKGLTLSQFALAMLEKACWMRYFDSTQQDPRSSEESQPYIADNKRVPSALQDLVGLVTFWKGTEREKKVGLVGDQASLTAEYTMQRQSHQDLLRRNTEITAIIAYQVPNFLTLFTNTSIYYCTLRGKMQQYMAAATLECLRKAAFDYSPVEFIDYLIKTPLERAGTIFDLVARGIVGRIKEALTAQVAADLLETEETASLKPAQKRKSKKKPRRPSSNASTTSSPTIRVTTSPDMSDRAEDVAKWVLEGVLGSVGAHIEASAQATDFQTVQSGRKRRESSKKQLFPGGRFHHRRTKQKAVGIEIPPAASCSSGPVSPAVIKWASEDDKAAISFQAAVDFPPLCAGTSSSWEALSQELAEFRLQVCEEMEGRGHLMAWIMSELREAISHLFPGAYIAVFGSYATGLALPTSDLDIAVLNTAAMYEDIEQSVTMLEEVLPAYPWVASIKAIATASIPVVKLTVNPQFCEQTDLIQVDITFEDEGGRHMGVATCAWVLELLNRYPQCQECFLPLKQLLFKHCLNSAYHGGLSSYSLLLWLAAFLTEHPTQAGGSLLLSFLQFYGSEFNPKTTGISLTSQPYFYPRPQPAFTLCETIDPLRGDNNTTKGAYRVAEVQELFRRAYAFVVACEAHGQGKLLGRLMTRVDLIKT